ncbi:MAG: cupin domain-containing protein [Promethearchaeota archaeon]
MSNFEDDWDVPLGSKKEKPWGYERPIGKFRGIFLKELFFYKGKASSLHYHEEKDEYFYLVRGQLKVLLEDKEVLLNPGDSLHIPKKQRHRLIPQEDTLILELGTRMFGDVIRIKDEYGRT